MKVKSCEINGRKQVNVDGVLIYFDENPAWYNTFIKYELMLKSLGDMKETIITEYKDESRNKFRRTKQKVAKGQVAVIDKIVEILVA